MSTTPRNGVRQSMKATGPRTPSANRLAVAERGAGVRVERGETAPVEAHYAQSSRAWRSGGDRKIMFDNRGGHALTPEAERPVTLVRILHVCSWLLLATGMFQIVMSKMGDFKYPLHWVGVLMFFLGLMASLVRVYTNRVGTKPEWAGTIAVGTVAACLASWLLADGPLYEEVKAAEACTDENVETLCGIEVVDETDVVNECICQVASGAWDLCVKFTSSCADIPSNRRYLFFSIVSLWVGAALSSIVAVVSVRVVATTFDAGAFAKAEERKEMKMKNAGGKAVPMDA
ncbi:unnamed protein product [Pylaiella littoralis]